MTLNTYYIILKFYWTKDNINLKYINKYKFYLTS